MKYRIATGLCWAVVQLFLIEAIIGTAKGQDLYGGIASQEPVDACYAALLDEPIIDLGKIKIRSEGPTKAQAAVAKTPAATAAVAAGRWETRRVKRCDGRNCWFENVRVWVPTPTAAVAVTKTPTTVTRSVVRSTACSSCAKTKTRRRWFRRWRR